MVQSGWKHRSVLVTGGTGFIGKNLVKRLVAEGADVTLFVLDEETTAPHFLPIYRGNLINLQDIHRCVGRVQPEYVFHLASQPLVGTALRSVLDTLDSNITGGRNLLHACLDAATLRSIVYVTTDKVYDFTREDSPNEMSRLSGGGHPYNTSKVCADIIAQMYANVFKIPMAIVRSGNIYGGGDFHFDRLIPYICRQVVRGETIVLRSDGEYLREYIYIDDIVDAYLMIAELVSKASGNYGHSLPVNFGSHKPYSVIEVVNTVLSQAGKTVPVEIQNQAAHEIPEQRLDWSFAQKLGWIPKVSFKEGIKKTYEWYKEYFSGISRIR